MATNHPDAMENNKKNQYNPSLYIERYKSDLEIITSCLIKVDELVKQNFKQKVGDFLLRNQMKQLKDLQSDLKIIKSELEEGIRINTQILLQIELRGMPLVQAEELDIPELGAYPEYNSDFNILLFKLTKNQQAGIAGVATGTTFATSGLASAVVAGIATLGVAASIPGSVIAGGVVLAGAPVIATAVAGGFAAAWLYKAGCIGKERKVNFGHLIKFKDFLDANDKLILHSLIYANSVNKNILKGLQDDKSSHHQQQAQANNSKLKNICNSYKNTYKVTKNSLIEEGLAEDRANEKAREKARESVKNLLTPVITIEEVEDIVLD